MATDLILPAEVFCSGISFRSFGYGEHLGMMGCGFMQKAASISRFEQYPHYAAIYVLQGKGRFIDDQGQEFPVFPGSVFQRLPNKPHTLIIEDGEEWIEVFVGLKYLKPETPEEWSRLKQQTSGKWLHEINDLSGMTIQLLESLKLVDLYQPVLYPGLDLRLVKRLYDLYQQMKFAPVRQSQNLHFEILSILNQWRKMSESGSESGYNEELMQSACKILEESCSSRTPIPELLDGLGMGYSRLRVIFREVMGVSPGQYQLQSRLDLALTMLTHGKSIKETADKLGYDTPYAFSTQFKKMTGTTPTSVRKSAVR